MTGCEIVFVSLVVIACVIFLYLFDGMLKEDSKEYRHRCHMEDIIILLKTAPPNVTQEELREMYKQTVAKAYPESQKEGEK